MMLSLLLSAFMASPANCDTLIVGYAKESGPYIIHSPYSSEKQNMENQTFNILEALEENHNLLNKTPSDCNIQKIVHQGDELGCLQDSLPTLRKLEFSIQSNRFFNGKLEIKNLQNYKAFINGQPLVSPDLSIKPGRITISLLVLTQKEHRDSFNVKLIGEHLKDVEINSTSKRPFTMRQMIEGDHYLNAHLSPSGKFLVRTNYYVSPKGEKLYSTTLSEVKSNQTLIRYNQHVNLRWAPGTEDILYYTQNRNGKKALILVNPQNKAEKILVTNLPEGSIQLTPNMRYLVISKTEKGKYASNGVKMLREPDDRMPGWRNRNSLWLYNIESGIIERLTSGSTQIHLSDISDDSKYLLLEYKHFDASKTPFDRTGFLRMNIETREVDTLMVDTTYIADGKFSPNGEQLVVLASPAAFNRLGCEIDKNKVPNAFDYRLYLYDVNNKAVTPLLKNFKPAVEQFMWSRGNNHIYFTATDGTGKSLFSVDTSKNNQITKFDLPISYIQGYSIAPTHNIPSAVVWGQSATRAREMFVCQLNKKKPKCNLTGNIKFDEIYKNISIGECKDWRFKSSRGDSIDGFYFLPENFDKTQKYPLIVYYYGGCVPTCKALEFQYPLQILASQGYVVYVINPSGATGYGQDFASRHVNTWGKESGDDIIEGTKTFCQEHTFIDSKLVGCMGASYGGFMTQYLQTRTDLFATAVSHAGISNITSYWGGGYWGYSYGEIAQYGSYPWNNPQLYIEQSPLFNADKIKTPLLLLHGTADTNVPTNESQQLYNALKILGKEVCYVQVEGENHVITNFDKRLQWQDVIFAWFAKYLKKDDNWWKHLDL